MNDQDYITQRLEEQQKWLDGKAATNQRWFKRLRLVEIGAAALIPAVTALHIPPDAATTVTAVLGMLIAIIAGAMGLNRFQENWVQYRTTAEQLKHERVMYETQTGPYTGADRFSALVERVEKLLMKENATWAQVFAPKTGGNGAGSHAAHATSPDNANSDKPADVVDHKPSGT